MDAPADGPAVGLAVGLAGGDLAHKIISASHAAKNKKVVDLVAKVVAG